MAKKNRVNFFFETPAILEQHTLILQYVGFFNNVSFVIRSVLGEPLAVGKICAVCNVTRSIF